MPVSSCRAAELAKLLENTFRHVNIALVNELAMVCHEVGIDVWEVIDAAATKPFGFMRFHPGPGVGGHCIPLDPAYLAWQVRRDAGQQFRILEQAEDINSQMPTWVANRIGELLNEHGKAVNGARGAGARRLVQARRRRRARVPVDPHHAGAPQAGCEGDVPRPLRRRGRPERFDGSEHPADDRRGRASRSGGRADAAPLRTTWRGSASMLGWCSMRGTRSGPIVGGTWCDCECRVRAFARSYCPAGWGRRGSSRQPTTRKFMSSKAAPRSSGSDCTVRLRSMP